MTEREKMIEIIKQASEQAYADFHELFREGVKRVRDGEISCFTNRDVRPTHDEILADKLIEAGFGNCAALTEKWRALLETQCKKTEKAEHRAEVAERAFSKLVHEMYEHGIRPMCDEKFFVESRLKDADTTARIERAQLRWGNTVVFGYDVRVIDDGERETIHILPMPIGYGRQLGAKEDEETEAKDDERPKKDD